MTLSLVTAPAHDPISLAEAKEHLREEGTGQDGVIAIYVAAATRAVEAWLGRALIDQTWDLNLDGFPATGGIKIPLPPLIEVVGVFSSNEGGAEAEFTDFTVSVGGLDATVTLATGATWPTATAVRIRFRAGYLDASSPPVDAVPGNIKAGILLTMGTLYANRESVVVGLITAELPKTVEWLLRPSRVALGMA